MKNLLISFFLMAHAIGIAQKGCDIFPEIKNTQHSKPFFSNTYLEFNTDVLTSYDKDVKAFTNSYFIPLHFCIAQKIKKRVVLHAGLGAGMLFEEGIRKEGSFGAGKIGIDYFFKSSMDGFGIGLYGHGNDAYENGIAIPMFHLMYTKSNKMLFNQYHFSVIPLSGGVIFAIGLGIGYKIY
jgi:hypothetical protein